jgi:triosephosphate isomerase
VRAKAEAGLGAGLLVVLCVGETEAEWLEGRTLERLSAQLEGSLPRGDATGSRRTVWSSPTSRSGRSAPAARPAPVTSPGSTPT